MNHPEVFEKSFPTALRPQGKEIVRTWLYYTLLKSALLLDKPGFQHVWIDGLEMDPWGRKMSKSLGNGIDADSVLECGSGGRTGSWKVKGPENSEFESKIKLVGMFPFMESMMLKLGMISKSILKRLNRDILEY